MLSELIPELEKNPEGVGKLVCLLKYFLKALFIHTYLDNWHFS